MGFFSRKSKEEVSLEELGDRLEKSIERAGFFQETVRGLLVIVKAFSFDLKELDAESFKKRLDELLKAVETDEEPVRRLQRLFAEEKTTIMDFLRREEIYFTEKEKELKTIIQLLIDGLQQVSGENQEFNSRVYESNMRMEQITYLDDIRKIKESIKSEVTEMKKVVQEKQARETDRMERLSQEVRVLKQDLVKAEQTSVTDGLTGAVNRLGFDEQVRRMVERSLVMFEPFSLLLCDLDNFKNVNDTYGHQVGDRVLKAFVQECKGFFRKDDFIARYGGEEFAVLLPQANLRNAMKRARAFCRLVATKRYLFDPKEPDKTMGFTLSIGVSTIHKNDKVDALIARADKALYEAKQSGKNRAVTE